jgi:hypothetical protein
MLDFRFFLMTYAALGETPALPANRKTRMPVPRFSTLKTMRLGRDGGAVENLGPDIVLCGR